MVVLIIAHEPLVVFPEPPPPSPQQPDIWHPWCLFHLRPHPLFLPFSLEKARGSSLQLNLAQDT